MMKRNRRYAQMNLFIVAGFCLYDIMALLVLALFLSSYFGFVAFFGFGINADGERILINMDGYLVANAAIGVTQIPETVALLRKNHVWAQALSKISVLALFVVYFTIQLVEKANLIWAVVNILFYPALMIGVVLNLLVAFSLMGAPGPKEGQR